MMRNRSLANATSSISIDVLIVIDTKYLKANYPNPSQDPYNPIGIDHGSQFMICTGTRGVISGQGTADLNFKANPNDFISFHATSISGNADDAVMLYDVKYWTDGDANDFMGNVVKRTNAVRPNINAVNGLPADTGVDSFISFDSHLVTYGEATFSVYFALYALATDGETQTLYGYYYWNPTIAVSL